MLTRHQLLTLCAPAMSIGQAEERTRRAVTECLELHDNLTATQARCTALLEEKRALAADLALTRAELNALKPRPFVNAPSPALQALFIVGSAIGAAAILYGQGPETQAIGTIVGAFIGFAASHP